MNAWVFCVEVCVSGRVHTVEKRYTEFEELHKQLKKIEKTPEFPPKKIMKWNHKVLEHRRVALQKYLQGVMDSESIPKCYLKFLEISMPAFSASFDSLDDLNLSSTVVHQPVVSFVGEAFLQDNSRSSLPDIIVQGVNRGLYSYPDDV
ncbi:sorting nexin-24-like [Liolophura sinensis]|uniref:sorting nexin-24-like n=1 Tax=Liolophura sinensis TaxID=3198878 RepID=UPI0031588DC7